VLTLKTRKVNCHFHEVEVTEVRSENNIITYLLTPRCRVLFEKLTGLKLLKKFLAFHGTRRFITALTSVRHLSLSWTKPFQSIYPHPTSWRSILILSTHLNNNIIIISIIIVEIVLNFMCVILFTFLRIKCKPEERSRSG